jgi:hypothetical protein
MNLTHTPSDGQVSQKGLFLCWLDRNHHSMAALGDYLNLWFQKRQSFQGVQAEIIAHRVGPDLC